MSRTVFIDCFAESARIFGDGFAVVAVDVIRATTTAITAVARGRRCFPVSTLEMAMSLSGRLEHPLLGGELGGNVPYEFDVNNSPAAIEHRDDVHRPLILLSSAGTRLMYEASHREAAYACSLQNVSATADFLSANHDRVAVIGAGTRGEFREEDQYCCARLAHRLVKRGFVPGDASTARYIAAWAGKPPRSFLESKSVTFLKESDQIHDLNFILSHVEDLNDLFVLQCGELVRVVRPPLGQTTPKDAGRMTANTDMVEI